MITMLLELLLGGLTTVFSDDFASDHDCLLIGHVGGWTMNDADGATTGLIHYKMLDSLMVEDTAVSPVSYNFKIMDNKSVSSCSITGWDAHGGAQ